MGCGSPPVVETAGEQREDVGAPSGSGIMPAFVLSPRKMPQYGLSSVPTLSKRRPNSSP